MTRVRPFTAPPTLDGSVQLGFLVYQPDVSPIGDHVLVTMKRDGTRDEAVQALRRLADALEQYR